MKKSLSVLVGLVLLGMTIFACANAGNPSPNSFARPSATLERPPIRTSLLDGTPAPPPSVTGKFIFAPGDGSIWLQDPANGKAKPVIKPSPELFADAPSFAPDGNSFVYVRSSLNAQGIAQNAIYRANLDGSQNEPVALPPDNKTAYNWPHYSWDGKWIYYTSSFPVPPNKQESVIQRMPVGGGEAQTIVRNARMSTEAPDGKTIAFIRFNFDTFTAGLWTANIDGSNEREILNDEVFILISAPQYAPDGKEILFAASGPNTRPLPGVQSFHAPTCFPQLLCRLAKPVYADGLPWDLWTVTPDGNKFTRITQVGADSPWPAWSRDSTQIAFFDTSGQYLVDVTTRALSQISKNGGHGVFGWWQP
jgi:Tol biopolymer transport system component